MDTGCGTADCPWMIEAKPGQRITVSIRAWMTCMQVACLDDKKCTLCLNDMYVLCLEHVRQDLATNTKG